MTYYLLSITYSKKLVFNRNFEMYLNIVKNLDDPSQGYKDPNNNVDGLDEHFVGL